MGGCYESGYRYTPKARSLESDLSQNLGAFFKTGDRKHLIVAYRGMLKEGSAEGFIKKIHEYRRITTAPKEFSEYEIEAKMNIQLNCHDKKFARNFPSAKTIASMFDFQPTESALFLKDEMLSSSVGTNAFYGTEEGEERLVLIKKGGKDYKKEKGSIMPYDFGILFEEYILRRSETRIPTYPAEVAEAMIRLNQDSKMKHVGTIKKEKVDFFLLNTVSGREYGCTVSEATLIGDENAAQHQLEIEYAGYIPGFKQITLKKEEEIVNEISQLYKLFLIGYGMQPVQIDENWAMRLIPTKERKFDFASGRKSEEGLEKVVVMTSNLTRQMRLSM